MKKGMMVVTMFAALSFLVSVIVVSPSFAVKATQTAPKPQQQPSVPPLKEKIKAKDRFWDLAVDYCIINGAVVDMSPCNVDINFIINLKVGQTASFNCYYKVMTIPVHDITDTDAKYWGAGNLRYKLLIEDGKVDKKETRSLPHFTWEDVKKWQISIKKPGRKTWVNNIMHTWTPTEDYIGNDIFLFRVDDGNLINETTDDDQNGDNNECMALIKVNP